MTSHPILHIPVPRFPEAEPQRGDSIRAWAVALRLSYPDDPEGVLIDAAMIADFVINGGLNEQNPREASKPGVSRYGEACPSGAPQGNRTDKGEDQGCDAAAHRLPSPDQGEPAGHEAAAEAGEASASPVALTPSQGPASPRAGLPAGSGCDEIPAVIPPAGLPAPAPAATPVPMDGYEAAKAGHPLRANPHTEELQALAWADGWWRHHHATKSVPVLPDAPRAAARNPFTEIRSPASPTAADSAPCQDDAADAREDSGRGTGADKAAKPGAPRSGLLRTLDAIALMVGQGTLHPRVPEVAALSGVPATSVPANMTHLRKRGWIETRLVDGQKITRITDAAPPVHDFAEPAPVAAPVVPSATSIVSPGPVLADASVAQGEGHPSVPSGPEVQAPGECGGQDRAATDGRETAKVRKPSPVSIPTPARVKPRASAGVTTFPLGGPLGAIPKAAPAATAPSSVTAAPPAPSPRSEEERQIAEFVARKGVRRYEPGTLENIIAATLRQEGIVARLSGAIGSQKSEWLVTIKGKEQRWNWTRTLARANEIRLSAGLEPLGRPAPDAAAAKPSARKTARKNAA